MRANKYASERTVQVFFLLERQLERVTCSDCREQEKRVIALISAKNGFYRNLRSFTCESLVLYQAVSPTEPMPLR